MNIYLWITVCCRSAVSEKPHFWKNPFNLIKAWDLYDAFAFFKAGTGLFCCCSFCYTVSHARAGAVFTAEQTPASTHWRRTNIYLSRETPRTSWLNRLLSSPPICLSVCLSCEWRDDTHTQKKKKSHTDMDTACHMVWAADISLQVICSSESDALMRIHSYKRILSVNEGCCGLFFFPLAHFSPSKTRARRLIT